MTAPEPMSPEQHAAVEAELVRLTLGGRGPARPELRVDAYGNLYRAAQQIGATIRQVFVGLRAAGVTLDGIRAGAERAAERAARGPVPTLNGRIGDPFGIPVVLDDTLEPGTFRIERRPPGTP